MLGHVCIDLTERVSVEVGHIYKFFNIDLGGKGDFLALINLNQYILVLIVTLAEKSGDKTKP